MARGVATIESMAMSYSMNLKPLILFSIATCFLNLNGKVWGEEAACEQLEIKKDIQVIVQNSFLRGDYNQFFKLVDPYLSDGAVANEQNMERISNLAPDGFASCTSLLTEFRSERLLQNLTVYKTHDGKVLFLLIIFAKFEMSFEVIKYHISSDLDALLIQLL